MKTIGRDKLRGKPLDHECYSAHTTRHEYGMDDNRVFCHGFTDAMTDIPLDKCIACGAFIENAKPPKED